MIAGVFTRDPSAAFGRFCAILIGVALTWTCAAFGLLLVTFSNVCGDRSGKIAKYRVREIDAAIAMYAIDHGRCPGTIDDLVAAKYLGKLGSKDPWGTTFAISCSSDDSSVRSAGRDRRFGTADDIPHRY